LQKDLPGKGLRQQSGATAISAHARSNSKQRHDRRLETRPLSAIHPGPLETMEAIREAGGKFQSLSEPWADTTTHAGKMIMTIFAGIAEFERDLIRERTSAGREAARKRGVRFGRPRKLSVDQEQLARRLVLEGRSVSDIARTFNVHVATIYRLAETQ